MDTCIDMDEAVITASLTSMVDIPPASAGFERRCFATVASMTAAGRTAKRRRRALRAAAAFAVAAAALAGVAPLLREALPEDGAGVREQAEDVSIVGVKGPDRSACGTLATSNECVVNANPGATALWKTLNAGQAQMAWEWPERAKSARLTISGGGVTAEKVYVRGDAFPVWNPPVPERIDEDEVFTAKLTFYDGENGGGDELECIVADGMGFVRGISGTAGGRVPDGLAAFRIARK